MPRSRTASRAVVLSALAGLAFSITSATFAIEPPKAQVDLTPAGELRVDGRVVHTTGAKIEQVVHTQLGTRGAASLTWTEDGLPKYAFTRDGGATWSPAFDGSSTLLKLRWRTFDPVAEQGQAPARDAAIDTSVPAHLRAAGAHSAFIVQFPVPIFDVVREELEALGVTVLTTLPDTAVIVSMDPARAEAVRAMPGVRWVGAYEPAYKADPALLRGYLPAFGAADASARANLAANWERGIVERMEGLANGTPQAFWVQVWGARTGGGNGVVSPVKLALADAVEAMGGTLLEVTPDDDMMRVELTQEQLVALLADDRVAFVDPWAPGGTDMDIERIMSGANVLETVTSFSGEGVRGEVLDSGLLATHQGFSVPGPAPIIRGVNGLSLSHGTACFGIIFGDGSGNAAGRGLVPDAQAKFFYAYEQLSGFGGAASRLTVTNESVNTNQVVFQSNSFGTAQTTVYTTVSQAMDQIIFQTGLLICQSQSNTGNQNSRPEAWAKNVLAVGAYTHANNTSRADDTAGGASRGPAADGRVKPELSHHFDNVLATTSTSDTAYTATFGGTSAATPITCGYMGLIFQLWHEGGFPGFGQGTSVFASRPFATTARALAINSAFRYNWTGAAPINATINRNFQGWGSIDVANLLNLAPTLYVENEAKNLLSGQTATYTFDVAPATPALRATMVFSDPPGTVSATQHSINNLSLRVTGPTGTIWWGNNGLSLSNWSTTGGVANAIDTVENVFIQNPAPGRYRLEVLASAVTQDSNPRTPGVIDASYALVVSGAQRTPLRVLAIDTVGSGICSTSGTSLSLGASPAFAQLRTWLSDPRRFGGAGGLDRPVSLLAPVGVITAAALANADVVVLTGAEAVTLTSCELGLLSQFLQQGGGLLAMDDIATIGLAPLVGATPGTFRPAGGLALGAAGPVLSGGFGTVGGPVQVGLHTTFTDLGPSGTALLTSSGQAAAARFTIGSGRAVIIGDADWASSANIAGCVTAQLPNINNERFFLNALAFVAPTVPISYSLNASCCDSTDFNQDGDFPTPLDLEDFINANAGSICATCSTDLDFNNDGDFPTPLDVEAFISVLGGGPCL